MGAVKSLYMDVFELYEANEHSLGEIAEQLGVDAGLVEDIVYDIVNDQDGQPTELDEWLDYDPDC